MKNISIIIIEIILIIILGYFCFINLIHSQNTKLSKTENFENIDINNIWCGSFDIAWQELKDYLDLKKIEFEDDSSVELLEKLNTSKFNKNMLDEKSYYLKSGKANIDLKNQIINDVNDKFNFKENSLEFINNPQTPNEILVYSLLIKKFNFIEKFDELNFREFGDTKEEVRCFGISKKSEDKLKNNVEILNFDYYGNYTIKLKTKENDEVILTTIDDGKNFNELYNYILSLNYDGEKEVLEHDIVTIPYINIDVNINYDELCGKQIKNSTYYLIKAMQKINFNLNSIGGKIESKNYINSGTMSASPAGTRDFDFSKPFTIFIKEKDKEMFYFAAKIENTKYLIKEE